MILDTQSTFSTAQAVTATAISTNVMDTRSPQTTPALTDEGMWGGFLWLNVFVLQVFNNLTSLLITLESDSTANLATAPVVHYSKVVLLAGLTANTQVVRVQIPSDNYKQFLGVRYTVTGTAPTTGTITSMLSLNAQRNVPYPSGFSVA